MAINSVVINSTDTLLLEVPAGKTYAITTIMVCNTWTPNPLHEEDGKTNFDMHFIQSGQPRGNDNLVINQLELPAGETFTFDSEKVILEEGDKVVVLGDSPNNLSATISWLEV
jgi:hypothetical protein